MGPAIKSIKETTRQIYRTRLTLEWLSANSGTPVDPSARVENSEAQPGPVSLCSHCMKVIACRNGSSTEVYSLLDSAGTRYKSTLKGRQRRKHGLSP